MKLSFKEIELPDREWMDPLLTLGGRGSLDYSFTTCFLWRYIYNYRVARLMDYLILKSEPGNPTYLFPSGQGPLEPVIDAMIADAAEAGVPLRFNTILPDDRARLEEIYPGRFTFEEFRDGEDYLYETEALASLAGKKLAAKRNHIHRFLENESDWTYEEITDESMDEVRQMNMAWCLSEGGNPDEAFGGEFCAVEQALKHYHALHLSGGLLRAGGKVIAFSIGDPLSDDVYLVHFEKAYAEIQGAYPMINQQFVLHNCMNHTYVDREEDAGVEGLRKAKLSYHPFRLVEKYTATLKG